MGNFKKAKLFSLPSTSPRYEKFVNYIMRKGKKNTARKILQMTLEEIKKAGHLNPLVVWESALENASPHIMIRSKRIGGAVYQIPLEVPSDRRFYYASTWILTAARAKKGKPMYKKLAEELLAAYSNAGSAVKKKEDVHKMAESNRAYAYLAKYVK